MGSTRTAKEIDSKIMSKIVKAVNREFLHSLFDQRLAQSGRHRNVLKITSEIESPTVMIFDAY